MHDTEGSKDSPANRLVSRRLAPRDRIACAAVGLGTILPAEVATFLDHDSSALVGLTVVGGIALIIAGVGWIPGRTSIGDKVSFEFFEEDLKAVDALAEQISPQALNQLAIESAQLETASQGPVVARIYQHAVFEQQMLSIANTAALEANASIAVEPVSNGMRWDALVSKGNRMIYIEARLRLDSRSVRELRDRVQELPRGAQLLLVVGAATDGARALLTGLGDIVLMLVREDGANLEQDFVSTVRRLLDEDD